jgi:hypothetical protein
MLEPQIVTHTHKTRNAPGATDNDTYPEDVEEMDQLRYAIFQSTPTTTTEIEHLLKTLKPNNSYGYDEISNKLLKITAPVISSPLNYICNKVLTKGIFPDRLKYSTIKPLPYFTDYKTLWTIRRTLIFKQFF